MTSIQFRFCIPPILIASILALTSSVEAQLEFLSNSTNLENVPGPEFQRLVDQINNGNTLFVRISGEIIPSVGGSAIAPFEIDENSNLPIIVTASVLVDTTRNGPRVSGGNGNVGYQGSQILAVYIQVNDPQVLFNSYKQIGYTNFLPLISDFDPVTLFSTDSGGGANAELWVDQDLVSGTPTVASIRLDNGNESFRFGPIHAIQGILGGVFIKDELGNFSEGSVTDVSVQNVTSIYQAGLSGFFDHVAIANVLLIRQKKLFKKAKKKAKKLEDSKAKKKAIKKAKKKLSRAQIEFDSATNSFGNVGRDIFF